MSGIWVSKSGCEEQDKEFCRLATVKTVADPKSLDKEDTESIRLAEMLRHFPTVARQFHRDGTLMDQNPDGVAWSAAESPCSKMQSLVERAAHGSEFVAGQTAMEEVIDVCLKLHVKGAQIDGSTCILETMRVF